MRRAPGRHRPCSASQPEASTRLAASTFGCRAPIASITKEKKMFTKLSVAFTGTLFAMGLTAADAMANPAAR